MRKKFCCEASRHIYDDYYLNQGGQGLPVFTGYSGQRGHGLGSLLSGLFRSAMPMIKRGLATFGRHALKTGLEIANDVAGGENLKHSAKRRVTEGIKSFVNPQNFSSQQGSGRKRVVTLSKRKRAKFAKKKRKHKDIFN